MQQAIVGKQYLFFDKKYGTGAIPDPKDARDLVYDSMALGAPQIDWEKGYDIEKQAKIIIPFKNQDGSSSCVGQAWSYYVAVLNAIEVGKYDEASAKAFYSQFFLPGGGAYLRNGGKLAVNWGAVTEKTVPSYNNGDPPSESFITDKSWKNPQVDKLAQTLQAKEYRTISSQNNMDIFAAAIRDNFGVVGGVYGSNNGTWNNYEPKPPTASDQKWGHALFFGKFGMDSKGKFIATPNSWGGRKKTTNYPDAWQKLREDYFTTGNMFNPWTLTDKPNFTMSPETEALIKKNEKNFVIEAEGTGRKGIIINGVLRPVVQTRVANATLYKITVDGGGVFVKTNQYEEIPKGDNF